MLPRKLQHKLDSRKQNNAFRKLGTATNNLVDFSSNDYLGFSKSEDISRNALTLLKSQNNSPNGATGSRLLSGNHKLFNEVEQQISTFHNTENALIFNSGYTTNLGLLSCVPQRHDIILYDEYCHASIRDGITMSHAKSYKFEHNNLEQLEQLIARYSKSLNTNQSGVSETQNHIYVVTESVFSMDGDSPNLNRLSQICKRHQAHLIIDEAHDIGVMGTHGRGLINELKLEQDVFARIITFGKALGCHGAAILCSNDLKEYLINFSKPFIYTTALPPHSLATLKATYDELEIQSKSDASPFNHLQHHIIFFKTEIKRLKLQQFFIESKSAIQCCVIPGNTQVKYISEALKHKGFDVKAILSPTVPKDKERLRFCIHAYNTEKEITEVLQGLTTFAKS